MVKGLEKQKLEGRQGHAIGRSKGNSGVKRKEGKKILGRGKNSRNR